MHSADVFPQEFAVPTNDHTATGTAIIEQDYIDHSNNKTIHVESSDFPHSEQPN